MALFKCKMCGGDLEVAEGVSVLECEYCGTKQTVPTAKDENLQALYNRANTLRMKSEFDKAEQIYEKIIQADETQAEAYWGLILSKYGIEYVEDPATFKRIPTCHRTSFDSIIADDDYKSALANADAVQRAVYETEAKEIDRIQKEILSLSQKEEPYDVFICYKEKDENGKRTPDSVVANDIYYQLTQEGFKVFYAAITLEDKLGSAYEPCIFAALNSAKVMLAIGTKPQHFNAVWVKNEWSRFLKLMKKDRSKLLIPCYRDMDAYELPEEFAHLQAQDMSKIGFINDVVRGIKKVISKDEPKMQSGNPAQRFEQSFRFTKKDGVWQETNVLQEAMMAGGTNGNPAPLLERAFLFLEDGAWQEANIYCEKVLDIDPKNAKAYLGKLMAELHVRKQDALADCAQPFDGKPNYQKVIRFGDEELATTLRKYIESINTRNKNARLEGIYQQALSAMTAANNEKTYKDAAGLFVDVLNYKDSAALQQECFDKAEACRTAILEKQYNKAVDLMQTADQMMHKETAYKEAAHQFSEILNYKNSAELQEECFEKAEICRKDAIYASAKSSMERGTIDGYHQAINRFWAISGWRDANDQKALCQKKIDEIVEKEAVVKETSTKKKKTAIRVTIIALVMAAVICFLWITFVVRPTNYKKGVALMDAGNYSEALAIFDSLNNYKDSVEYGKRLRSQLAPKAVISAGGLHTVALKSDGTVVAIGNNEDGQCDVTELTNIVSLAAGYDNTVALKSDGTVVAAGRDDHVKNRDVDQWQDIVMIAAGRYHTVGLKSDGTVVAVGGRYDYWSNVSEWTDIMAIAAGDYHTVGLKSDGTVVATGGNSYGQCDVSEWTDIVAISADGEGTVGLKSDGTAVKAGIDSNNEGRVVSWAELASISKGEHHTVALQSDGDVFAVGWNDDGQCNVVEWENVVTIAAGGYHTVAIKSDGAIVAVGNNNDGQCDVSSWTDIKQPKP